MLEKPQLKDGAIVAYLKRNFGVARCRVDFLPYGNDPNSWAYKVTTDQGVFFLKVRSGQFYPGSALVPRSLNDFGIEQVVAPLPTRSGKLSGRVGRFTVMLFPFIFGKSDEGAGFTNTHWRELGSVLRRIHDTKLPTRIRALVRTEKFFPWELPVLRQLQNKIEAGHFADRYQKQLAKLWRKQQANITRCVIRAKHFAKFAKRKRFHPALCHADMQPANMRLTATGELLLADWDGVLFAPKERDLMFLLGRGKDEAAFFQGYGNVPIDPVILSYYRYEWALQEFADYGGRIFLLKGLGEKTKQHALDSFAEIFTRGNVVDAAARVDRRQKRTANAGGQ